MRAPLAASLALLVVLAAGCATPDGRQQAATPTPAAAPPPPAPVAAPGFVPPAHVFTWQGLVMAHPPEEPRQECRPAPTAYRLQHDGLWLLNTTGHAGHTLYVEDTLWLRDRSAPCPPAPRLNAMSGPSTLRLPGPDGVNVTVVPMGADVTVDGERVAPGWSRVWDIAWTDGATHEGQVTLQYVGRWQQEIHVVDSCAAFPGGC